MDTLLGVPIEALGIGSGWALTAIGVLMIFRGALIPRRTYEDVMHDRDEWRAAHRISETARVEGEVQRNHMAESARAFEQLMRELQERLASSPVRGDRIEEVP